MANLVVTGTTEAVTLTESAAGVDAGRTVVCATEAISLTANGAGVGIFHATVSMQFTGLGGIGLIATGLTDLNSLFETAYASESLSGAFDWEITDVVIAGDATFAIWSQALTDVVNVTDVYTHDWIAILADTATASNVLGPVIWDAHLSPSGFRAQTKITTFLSEYIVTSLTATDSFPLIGANAYLEDLLTIATPVLTSSVTSVNTLTAVVNATSAVTPIALETLVTGNAVLVTETITDTTRPQAALTAVLTAAESSVNTLLQSAMLTSVVDVLDSWIIAAGVANDTITTTFYAKEILWAKDFGALAWVLNMETGGLSTYDNFGFNSVVAHDGVLYATSPEGVFALDGDLDQTRQVSSRVMTGMLDFDIDTKKRISDIFVGYTGGRLSYEVETYDGPIEVYEYEMPERLADAPCNNRVKPGRGLNSRYWRFAIENIDGSDFQLHDQTAVVGASNRRL